MLFRWLRERRRRAILEDPFPEDWRGYLRRNVAHYPALNDDEASRLEQLVQVFVAEKHWEGCGGLELDDEIRATIAAQACLLILGHDDHDLYRNIDTILVYPSAVVPRRSRFANPAAGEINRGPMPVLGEAHLRGPVILAWDATVRGGMNPRDGHNLVYHEFAHKLDMLDGAADGTPPLTTDEEYERWAEVCREVYVDLKERADRGRKTFLDHYGSTNAAEFFAVATEHFFEQGRTMRRKLPELYEVLKGFYRQDPASRPKQQR